MRRGHEVFKKTAPKRKTWAKLGSLEVLEVAAKNGFVIQKGNNGSLGLDFFHVPAPYPFIIFYNHT